MIRIMRMLSVPVLVGILGLLVLAACSRGASDGELLAAVSNRSVEREVIGRGACRFEGSPVNG